MVVRLHMALYCLRHVSRAWNEVLCKLVATLGIIKSKNSESLYILLSETDGKITIFVGYVDDIRIFGPCEKELNRATSRIIVNQLISF